MPKRLLLADLPEQERRTLEQIYGPQTADLTGYSVRQIDYLCELGDGEAWFFQRSHLISPHFCQQTLYKRKGKISPMRFNRTLQRLIAENELLRSNYCQTGDRTLRVVMRERRDLPEIVYRNLENVRGEELDDVLQRIMEADMRCEFDLARGILIRFSVFSTGSDECAILVTMPQLIAGGVDIRAMLRSLDDTGEGAAGSAPPRDAEPMQPPTALEASMRGYWEKMLADLPPAPSLPLEKPRSGPYMQTSYRITLPADFLQELRFHSRGNRMLLMAILQTAWGALLSMSGSTDAAFCLLAPVRSGSATGGMAFNMMPVRVRIDAAATVEKNVERQFQQIVISQPYSCFGWEELPVIAERGEKPFNHFLSFYDLADDPKSYARTKATPEGTAVMQNSWDAQGMRLGVYFHCGERTISISFLYDGNRFAGNAGKHIAERYRLVLQQLLTDWSATYGEFEGRLVQRLVPVKEDEDSEAQTMRMRRFISQLKLLHGAARGVTADIMSIARFVNLLEGDRISGEGIEERLYFVVEGQLARSIEAADGWYTALDIVGRNKWLNETALLPERKTRMSVEVLTEEATLMAIPLDEMKRLLSARPNLWQNLAVHAMEQMERYQRLWVQA